MSLLLVILGTERIVTMNTKIIALFNHKGGVSKTTTTYHLGWKISTMGKRVLLVDGDPQCNLTSLLLNDDFDDYYENDATKHNNIKDAVKMAFDGKPQPIKAIDCYSPASNPNLFLIPGHMDLSEYDGPLSFALTSNNAITTLQNLPGSFYELVRLCADKYNIDYVFIDMNPGLSSINQALFMMADGFIIPTNPDPFSVMAINTLTRVLPRWKSWAVQSRTVFADSAYPLPESEMRFVGEIIQRFNLRKGRAARQYEAKITEIKEAIETKLVPILNANGMTFDLTPFLSKGTLSDHCLAEIPEFGSLLQKAHAASVPVYALDATTIAESGNVLDQMLLKRDLFDEIFTKIALIIMELM